MATRFKRDWPRPEGWKGGWTPKGPIEVMDPEAIYHAIQVAAAIQENMEKNPERALEEAAIYGLTELPDPENDDAWDEIKETIQRRLYPEYYQHLSEDER